jgi:hypothetical protein
VAGNNIMKFMLNFAPASGHPVLRFNPVAAA